MQSDLRFYSLPRWRVMRWLADPGPSTPDDIRVALIGALYGTWPVFAGGAISTVAVAAVIAIRQPTPMFVAWLAIELALALTRLVVLLFARRAARARRETPTDLHILLALAWSVSVGFGVVISLGSGDWVVATLASVSAAAMVSGICFRNFSAPRLTGAMVVLSLGPMIPGVILAGEPLLYLVFLQVPLYLLTTSAAAFRLNRMLIATMRAARENGHLAHHDALTGLLNRAGFVAALAAKLRACAGAPNCFALLFFDLDSFKPINDTYGHAAGDDVLALVAERLRRELPGAGALGRIGGDEFVVLANDFTAEQALALGHRIIHALTVPCELGDGIRASVGVSVGIAMSQHGSEAEELLAIADAALYEAKADGKGCCRMASLDTNLAALRRMSHDRAATGAGTGAAA